MNARTTNPTRDTRKPRPPIKARVCRRCGQQRCPWPGTDELVCGCTQIAPLSALLLPFALPLRKPAGRWPGVPDDPRPAA